jgi:hypothetical protein
LYPEFFCKKGPQFSRNFFKHFCPSFFPLYISLTLSVFFLTFLISQPSLAAQIKLAWDPNNESDLAGYKIYYGTSPRTGMDPKSCGLCGFSTVVPVGNVTSYTIDSLNTGQTYYFSITAFDTSYNESAFSNQVSGSPPVVATQAYTITTNPAGLQIIVDGAEYCSPVISFWVPGSSHTLSVPSPQSGWGTQYVFTAWSDGGSQRHTITAPASSAIYTAFFSPLARLTTSAIGIVSNGTWYLDMNGNGIWEGCTTDLCFAYGAADDIPLMGDWNGDGIKTPGVYRPSTRKFYLRNSNTPGYADVALIYGIDGDLPIAGDWTGKGYDSIGVYRPSNSTFYLRNSNTTGVADIVSHYGIDGDLPIAGDWTGKGYDSIGVYRPSNSTFYLRNSNTTGPGNIAIRYGIPGDLPIAGDWDGDGVDTIGVYRPSTGEFYLRNSNTTGVPDVIENLGMINGDPIAGRW